MLNSGRRCRHDHVGGVAYTYTEDRYTGDRRDQFVALINRRRFSVTPSRRRVRIRLQSKIPGPDGDGTPITTNVTTPTTNTAGAQLLLTATNTGLCCASPGGTLITPANPAIPGETINIIATGLGLVCGSTIANAIDFTLDFIGFCSASPDPRSARCWAERPIKDRRQCSHRIGISLADLDGAGHLRVIHGGPGRPVSGDSRAELELYPQSANSDDHLPRPEHQQYCDDSDRLTAATIANVTAIGGA